MSKVAPSSSAEGPEQITFAEDGSSKKRSGVRRPVFAELLSCEAEATPKPGRVHLLVNPFSGRKRGKKVGAAARTLLEAAGVEVELHPSERAGHLVELSKALELRPTDALAVVGGDGTLSEVITGRMRAGGDLPAGDLRAFVRLGVRAQADAVGGGPGGHGLQITGEALQIQHQRRRLQPPARARLADQMFVRAHGRALPRGGHDKARILAELQGSDAQ